MMRLYVCPVDVLAARKLKRKEQKKKVVVGSKIPL
jgi:hypothetical protein